jgi:hypothetical protein
MNEELQRALGELQNSLSLANSLSVVQVALHLVVGGVLALYLRLLYRKFGATASDADSITRVFPLLTVVTTAVIAIVKSSLALSLGLVGALSIVRFRAAIKEPEELVYLFLCIAVGLSLGAAQPLLAVVLVLVASGFIIGMHVFGAGSRTRRIMLTVSGDSHRYFGDQDGSAWTRVQQIAGPCALQRMDIENGQGQLRVMLPRSDSRQISKIIGDLRQQLPDCEFSYVDMESTI